MIAKITEVSEKFAELIIQKSIAHPDSELATFCGIALLKITTTARDKGVALSKELIKSNHPTLIYSVAIGYDWRDQLTDPYSEKEIEIIKMICQKWNPHLSFPINSCLLKIATYNFDRAIEIFNSIDFSSNPKDADRALEFFHNQVIVPIKILSNNQINTILNRLTKLNSLNEHWIKNFLTICSEQYPHEVIHLLKQRVEHSEKRNDYQFQPLPERYLPKIDLLISKSDQATIILQQLKLWICEAPNSKMRSLLFAMSFDSKNPAIIDFLNHWIYSADNIAEINCAINIISYESFKFALENNILIQTALNKAESMGPKAFNQIEKAFFRCCTPTSKSGTSGGAFKEDVELRDQTDMLLKDDNLTLSLKNFYTKLNNGAKKCIYEAINDYKHTFDKD